MWGFSIRLALFASFESTYTMLWFYGHSNFLQYFSAENVFIRQNLAYKDGPRTEMVYRLLIVTVW